jgi:hypothetical protein
MNKPILLKHVIFAVLLIILIAYLWNRWANRNGNKPAIVRPGDPKTYIQPNPEDTFNYDQP